MRTGRSVRSSLLGGGGCFDWFSQTSTHAGTGRFAAKFPTTRSMSPSPSMSAASSVAWRGKPISIVCLTKCSRPGPLQPDQRGQRALVHIRPAGQQRAGDDVEIAIAVEIHGHRPVHAGQMREIVLDERIPARVLQPLNPVIRLHDPVVERVAVRQEHVEIAVAVHVHELDA